MMKFSLTAPLGRYGDAYEEEVHALKTALNHLGYYIPPAHIGIEEMREDRLFKALKAFQRDHGVPEAMHLYPYDKTVYAIDAALKKQNPTERYIWHTAGDDRVRDEHAAREEQVFLWGQPPEGGHPGEDFNCRCWAELVDDKKTRCMQLSIELQNTRLQFNSELEFMNKFADEASTLREKLNDAMKGLQEEIKDAGFEITVSLVPGMGGRIPVVSTIAEIAKNGVQIWAAYNEYLRIWDALKDSLDNQRWFEDRAKKTEQSIKYLLQEMAAAGCNP